MGVQERKLREKEGLRQEILDAARDLFAKEGYAAVSMRKIADKIEYSPTTIYLHFKDKTELFDCICEETFSKLINKLESLEKKGEHPLEALRKGLRAYVDFGLKHPNHYRITFMTDDDHGSDKTRAERRAVIGCKAFGCLQTSVAACFAENLFRDGDAEVISQILWAAVHGITSLLIVHTQFPWVDRNQLIDQLIEVQIEGLKRKSEV